MEKKYRTCWNIATRVNIMMFREMVEKVRNMNEADVGKDQLWELLDDIESIFDSEGVTL